MFLKRTIRHLNVLITILFVSFAAFGQTSSTASATSGSTKLMPVSAIREGMRGTSLTVFNGTVPEEFNVEILGVVPGAIGPKQDLIIGRISGGKAERTGVFAGMSGSPVFVDGKLIGAIAYSFPFAKEPICGITPIEQMISIFENSPTASAPNHLTSISHTELTNYRPASVSGNAFSDTVLPAMAGDSLLAASAGQAFRPIGMPLTFNGVSQRVLDMFAPQLMAAGLVPVASAGGSAPISPMKPANEKTLVGGTSVSMQLMRGDMSFAAAGTVTLREGDKIYAFGHPFLSLGSAELPMSESSVVTVVPNLNNSFKLAVPTDMVGTMSQDRATGVFGKLGQSPKLIPVRVTHITSRGQRETHNFEVVRDNFLTPLLVNIGVVNALVAQERSLGDSMVAVSGHVKLKNSGTVAIERRFAGAQANAMAGGSVAAPLAVLFRSGFDETDFESIEIELRSADGSRTASLERIAMDRNTLRPGETVNVSLEALTNTGRFVSQQLPIMIPADAQPGTYSIVVGDGSAVQKSSSTQQFVPRSLGELVQTINRVKLADRLYVQLVRTTSGAIVGAAEMPDLPPSIAATLNNDRSVGGVRAAVQTVVSETTVPIGEFIVSGEQKINIRVQ